MSTRRAKAPSRGKADFARMERMTEAEIEATSPEELRDLPEDFWDNAVLVPPAFKTPIYIRVDSDVLQFFRDQGPRYQSRINAVLKSYVRTMKDRRRS